MMEEGNKGFTINIHGGNNQILPNATEAKQIFIGDQFAQDALRKIASQDKPLTDDERRLAVFIDKEESLRNYIAQLSVCKTAAEVGEVVALMCENESHLDENRIVMAKFIETLQPLIPGVEKGLGIYNLRVQINKAWAERKQAIRRNSK